MIQKFNPEKTKRLRQLNTVLKIIFHEKKAKDPLNINNVKNILIIDPTLIGDLIMLIPFLRIIKKNAPHAQITLVCGSWGPKVLENQKLIDEFIIVNSKVLNSPKKLVLNWGQIKAVIKQVNKKQYDIALEPRGDLRYIFFMHFCKATRKVSYNYTGGECFLTDVIQPGEHIKHLVEDKLYFIKQLGCRFEEEDIYPQLFLTAEQNKQNEIFLKKNGIQKKTVIGIHPGASLEIKQWNGFADLLKKINVEFEDSFFLIFEGPNEENAVNKVVNAAKECGAEFFVSHTDITEYMQRLALCDAVICNDSGAGHIAAAFGVPVYVIFGPVLPELSKPYAKNNVFTFSDDQLQCKPCLSMECPINLKCLSNITADMVIAVIRDSVKQEN